MIEQIEQIKKISYKIYKKDKHPGHGLDHILRVKENSMI